MTDKDKHFIICFILSITLGLLTNLFISFVAVTLISLGKELYDKYIKRTFIDIQDLKVDLVGIIFGLIGAWGIKAMTK